MPGQILKYYLELSKVDRMIFQALSLSRIVGCCSFLAPLLKENWPYMIRNRGFKSIKDVVYIKKCKNHITIIFGESQEDEVWNTKNRSLHPASRPFGVRVRPHCVQLGLVESGRENFHFQKLSRNFAAYSEFFSSPWWRPGLRCGELGARHPWVELQPHLKLIFWICLVLHSTHFI